MWKGGTQIIYLWVLVFSDKFMVPDFKDGMLITKEDLGYLLEGVALLDERKKQIAI